MKYLVVYTSKTGNTEKIATEIFKTLPGKSKDIQRVEELNGQEAETYFVGFWNDRGTCSGSIMDFLSSIHGKRVALFGTCGMSGDKEYYKQVESRVSGFVPDDCQYLGCFLCGGRMRPEILQKYRQMQQVNDSPQIKKLIAAYEEGMLHPNQEDLDKAKRFVLSLIENIQTDLKGEK